MTHGIDHAIATNIILISIALVAATLIVIVPGWRHFCAYRENLNESEFGQIRWFMIAIALLSLVMYAIVLAMGLFGVELVRSVVILAAFTFSILGLIYLAVIIIWRVMRTRSLPSFKMATDTEPGAVKQLGFLAYGAALFHFFMVIGLAVTAMAGSMDVAFSMNVASDPDFDYKMSRWALRAAIPGFGIGLLALASGAFADVWSKDRCRRNVT